MCHLTWECKSMGSDDQFLHIIFHTVLALFYLRIIQNFFTAEM